MSLDSSDLIIGREAQD